LPHFTAIGSFHSNLGWGIRHRDLIQDLLAPYQLNQSDSLNRGELKGKWDKLVIPRFLFKKGYHKIVNQ
jgi:hypothetical protein